jgi:hypothetical protein
LASKDVHVFQESGEESKHFGTKVFTWPLDENGVLKKVTVVSVYKDNLRKIWPKPTLLDFGPFLYKDNLGKTQRVYF